jgi:hypothetical protein
MIDHAPYVGTEQAHLQPSTRERAYKAADEIELFGFLSGLSRGRLDSCRPNDGQGGQRGDLQAGEKCPGAESTFCCSPNFPAAYYNCPKPLESPQKRGG